MKIKLFSCYINISRCTMSFLGEKTPKPQPSFKLSLKCLLVLTAFLTNENELFIGKTKQNRTKQKRQSKFKRHYYKNRSLLFISLLKLVIQITKYGIPLVNSDMYLHLHLKGANFLWE